MQSHRDSTGKLAPKPGVKPAATKAVKKTSYDKLRSNGWGFLLNTLSPGTIKKLKGM